MQASLVAAHGLKLLCGIWNLPGSGVESMPPAVKAES